MLQRIWEVSLDNPQGDTLWFYTPEECTYRAAVLQGLAREHEFGSVLSNVVAMPEGWTPFRRRVG